MVELLGLVGGRDLDVLVADPRASSRSFTIVVAAFSTNRETIGGSARQCEYVR